MYDLVGDVHGDATALAGLLEQLGYRRHHGAWRHPSRIAVLVGDLIDRGPEIAETLRLVREMVDAGSALVVLGNHEWNALCYHVRDPDSRRGYLRSHSPAHRYQHRETVRQLSRSELADALGWFRGLPFSLQLPGARVVHACWDPAALAVLAAARERHGGLTDDFLIEAEDRESLLFAALEIVLKGREMALPAGAWFEDKDGHPRVRARVRWYLPTAGQTVASYTFPAGGALPPLPLPAKVRAEAQPYPATDDPVFFGHYWLCDNRPEMLAPNVICLDYSVARQGFLCGYRHEESVPLEPARFVAVEPNGRVRGLASGASTTVSSSH